jgi:hypothetical protein
VDQNDKPRFSEVGGSIVTPLEHYTVLGTSTLVSIAQDHDKDTVEPPLEQHPTAFIVYLDHAQSFGDKDSGTTKAKK